MSPWLTFAPVLANKSLNRLDDMTLMTIPCPRCGHQFLSGSVACPACNFVGPGATALSEADAAKIADGLLGPGWDANGSPVEA